MKTADFIKQYRKEDVETVICKHDGDVAYCNALFGDGRCCCDDYLCGNAIAVITKKENERRRYLALEH